MLREVCPWTQNRFYMDLNKTPPKKRGDFSRMKILTFIVYVIKYIYIILFIVILLIMIGISQSRAETLGSLWYFEIRILSFSKHQKHVAFTMFTGLVTLHLCLLQGIIKGIPLTLASWPLGRLVQVAKCSMYGIFAYILA